jgi:hypothetical protein
VFSGRPNALLLRKGNWAWLQRIEKRKKKKQEREEEQQEEQAQRRKKHRRYQGRRFSST